MSKPAMCVAAALLVLAGCTSNDPSGGGPTIDVVRLNLADHGAQPQTDVEPLRWFLNMTKRGCLWVATEGAGPPPPHRIDVIWPAGTTARRDDDGDVRIFADDGTVLAQVGGELNALVGSWRKPDGSTTFACRFGTGDDGAVYVQSPG